MREATAIFASDPRSAGEARRFATSTLHDWGVLALDAAVELLVSELVTNALLYSPGPITVVMRLDSDRLRCEVVDRSPQIPLQRQPEGLTTRGRGLALVDAYSDAWGVQADARAGKTVWLELTLPDAPPAPGAGAPRDTTVALACGHELAIAHVPQVSVLGASAPCAKCGRLCRVVQLGKFARTGDPAPA